MPRLRLDPPRSEDEAPEVEVVIEVPRGSFLKRGATGRVDFVSPLPCPFNYGSVPNFLGLEGDLLDALVLGPRLPFGTRLRVRAWGAVTLTDRGMSDDKLICSAHALTPAERRNVLRFFRFFSDVLTSIVGDLPNWDGEDAGPQASWCAKTARGWSMAAWPSKTLRWR